MFLGAVASYKLRISGFCTVLITIIITIIIIIIVIIIMIIIITKIKITNCVMMRIQSRIINFAIIIDKSSAKIFLSLHN